jgi:hypothetical protein
MVLKIKTQGKNYSCDQGRTAPAYIYIYILSIIVFYPLQMTRLSAVYPTTIPTEPNTEEPLYRPFHNDTTQNLVKHPENFFIQKLQAGEKIVIYQRGSLTGFGSFMLSYLMFAYYFNQTNPKRQIVLDESIAATYRLSNETGVSGFLDFSNLPVISNSKDYNVILSQLQLSGLENISKNPSTWLTNSSDNAIFMLSEKKWKNYYKFAVEKDFSKALVNNDTVLAYFRLAPILCSSVSFNAYTIGEIRQILNEHSIPNFSKSSRFGIYGSGQEIHGPLGTTVAFHVRRGDKLIKESIPFDEKLYVQKLLKIPGVVPSQIKHCYLATDEYSVTRGIQDSLKQYNIPCQLHFLVSPERDRPNRSDLKEILQFFTELHLLAHATYFVGSFNSNVGSFTSLFRKCSWEGNPGTTNDTFHHYHQSFGVDQEEWFIL